MINARDLFRGFGGRSPPEADALLKIINYISVDLWGFFALFTVIKCYCPELLALKKEGRAGMFSHVPKARNFFRGSGNVVHQKLRHF